MPGDCRRLYAMLYAGATDVIPEQEVLNEHHHRYDCNRFHSPLLIILAAGISRCPNGKDESGAAIVQYADLLSAVTKVRLEISP
jgi:hypothetical protein